MFLNDMSEDDLVWLTEIGTPENQAAGTVLISEGTEGPDVYILLSGRAAVVGAGIVLAHLVPGDVVGEVSLIDGMPASATVMLSAPAKILRIDRAALMVRLESGDGFSFRFHRAVARVLATRLRGTNQRVAAKPEVARALDRLKAA